MLVEINKSDVQDVRDNGLERSFMFELDGTRMMLDLRLATEYEISEADEKEEPTLYTNGKTVVSVEKMNERLVIAKDEKTIRMFSREYFDKHFKLMWL